MAWATLLELNPVKGSQSVNFDDSPIIDNKFSLLSFILFVEVLKRLVKKLSPFIDFFECGFSKAIFIVLNFCILYFFKTSFAVILIHIIYLRTIKIFLKIIPKNSDLERDHLWGRNMDNEKWCKKENTQFWGVALEESAKSEMGGQKDLRQNKHKHTHTHTQSI